MKGALIAAALVCTALIALSVLPSLTNDRPPYSLSVIDIADTKEERTQGLSNREVPEDYGMLFVFETEGTYGFWMKDTLAPLDVIWLSGNGTILGLEENLGPDTYPEIFYSPVPVRYVLEVRGGTSAARGWVVGTTLSLPLPE